MVLPIIKLGALLVKQLSKPIVSSLNESAIEYPKFRKFIIRLAQGYHWLDFRQRSIILGFGKPIAVKPLTDEAAVALGTKLFGEACVYGVSAAILLYEYNRSSKKEQIKEEKLKHQISTLERQINDYGIVTERQDIEIKELRRKMFELEDKNRGLASRLFGALKSEKPPE